MIPEAVQIPYKPRPFQREIGRLLRAKRFGVLVCHRRFGKTVLGVNLNQQTALMCPLRRPRCAYIGPTYTQAKTNAWDYMQHFARPIPEVAFNQSELRVDYPNGGQTRIFGADNPDTLRGNYFDRAVLDEYGMHPPKTFSEVIGPTLVDRGGSALFLGTPNGKNQFYAIAKHAQAEEAAGNPDWFFREYKASTTGLLDAAYLAAAAKVMTTDEYAQEFECSFEAAVKGAIFAKELELARAQGRITTVPHDPVLKVDTFWDLGFGGQGDATAIWFVQRLRSQEVRLIDYYEAQGEGLPHYAQVLAQRGYVYGEHYAPHDIAVKESTGKTRIETARQLGIRFRTAPNVSVEDGIHSARMIFNRCWFDATKCATGIEALQHYRRDYNARLNEFKATPVHDWACVTGDTPVLTRHGMYQIQYLPDDGEVLTPCGWKRFENPRITRRHAPLVAVTFSDGHTVRCTPEHRFLTVNGWKCAGDLLTGSLIQSSWTRSRSISMAVSIVCGRVSATTAAVARACIGMSGLRRLGRSLTAAISTIATGIRPITPWPIWSACLSTNISAPNGRSTKRDVGSISRRRLASMPPRGMRLRPDASGIGAMPSDQKAGPSGNENRSPANTVGPRWTRSFVGQAIRRSIALRPAKPLRIVGVQRLNDCEDVWCLTVPDGAMWSLPNGAVTHNSHAADAFRYLAVSLQPEKGQPTPPAPMYLPTSGQMAWGV